MHKVPISPERLTDFEFRLQIEGLLPTKLVFAVVSSANRGCFADER